MTDKKIRIILDSSSAKKNADDLDKSVRRVGKSADSSAFSMNRLAAAIAAVISVQKLKQYSDAWTSINNQLRQTVQTQEGLVAITDEMLRVSVETRQSLEATTSLYTRFRLSISETELSTERLIGVIETINKSLAIGGATAAESAGALRQLSQAIASGVLRGEEFNSIAEQAPEILRAVSAATGKTAGELRALAADGAITSEVLIKSLEAYADTVDTKFAASIPTIDQAFEVLRTNTISFVGNVNDALGASESFSKGIISLANTIGSAEFLAGFIELFDIARLTIDSATESTSQFSEELALLGDIGSESVTFVGKAFKELLPNVKSLVQVITVELLSVFDKVRVSATALYDIFSDPFDADNLKAATDKYHEQIEQINAVRQESIQQIFDEREAILSTAAAASQARLKEIEERRKARLEAPSSVAGSPIVNIGGGGLSDSKIASRDNAYEDEIAGAKSVTAALRLELETRIKVSRFYQQAQLAEAQGYFEQERAMLNAQEQERIALINQREAEDTQRREEQLRQALDHENLTEMQKLEISKAYDDQKLAAQQVYEEQRTAIMEEGIRTREQLDEMERMARLQSFADLGAAMLALGQGQSKKVFEVGKALSLAQATVSLPSAVIKSFENGGGYPWGLVPAAAMLATGLKNIQTIKNTKFGGGGGTPSIGGGGGGAGAGGPLPTTTGSQEQFQQKRVIEIRGIDKDSLVTGQQLADILASDDNVIVALNGAQQDAQRRGVI